MNSLSLILFLTLVAMASPLSPAVFGQVPAPAAVVNPASNTPAGLPNSGIAQGSIFVVYGKNLGPEALVQASSFPLPTSVGLSGTSVQITVNGTTTVAPMVYTLNTQVAAVLPSQTPIGTGTLTVTYNGQAGTTPIQVVASNFGISTINQTGVGPAVITRPDYSLITSTNSAKPGETLVLWGTGLGPITGGDAVIPTSGALSTPVQVLIGAQTATVSYKGRSAAPGLDQINFVVPGNVLGCFVSVAVQTNNTVSNYTTLPIASGGGTCSDPIVPSIDTMLDGFTGNVARVGYLGLSQSTITSPAIGTTPAKTTTSASAVGSFYKFSFSPAAYTGSISSSYTPTIGGCLVSPYSGSNAASSNPPTTIAAPPTAPTMGLDAGPQLAVTGPMPLAAIASPTQTGAYLASIPSALPTGTYTAVVPGGANVGPFSVMLSNGAALNWTNQSAVANVDRTQPLTLTWTGGDPNGYVSIYGSSLISTTATVVGATFICSAPVAAGQFTVPAPVLRSLPPSAGNSIGGFLITTGFLYVGSTSTRTFAASGLDFGFVTSSSFTGTSMTYN